MPLMRSNNEGERKIEVGQDTYTIQAWVSIATFNDSQAVISAIGMIGAHLANAVKTTDVKEMTTLAMSARNELQRLQLHLVKSWLISWSHSETMNEENMQRIPPNHLDKIVAAIGEQLRVNRGEVAADPKSSPTSEGL